MRIVVVAGALILVVVGFVLISQYTDVETVTFAQALQVSENSPEVEQSRKVQIQAKVGKIEQHSGESRSDLFLTDATGTDFRVEGISASDLKTLKVGAQVMVYGHAHGGVHPYFHASQIIR